MYLIYYEISVKHIYIYKYIHMRQGLGLGYAYHGPLPKIHKLWTTSETTLWKAAGCLKAPISFSLILVQIVLVLILSIQVIMSINVKIIIMPMIDILTIMRRIIDRLWWYKSKKYAKIRNWSNQNPNSTENWKFYWFKLLWYLWAAWILYSAERGD